MLTETQIKEKALELGFHGVGIASVDRSAIANWSRP